jgi:hypothetical protein
MAVLLGNSCVESSYGMGEVSPLSIDAGIEDYNSSCMSFDSTLKEILRLR